MKKILSILLCCIIALSSFPAFADVSDLEPDAPYKEAVKTIIALDIMKPLYAERFYPKQSVTRAEFIAYAIHISGFTNIASSEPGAFLDINQEHEYYPEVAMAKSMGMINGDGNGYFRPDEPILFLEAAKILCHVTGHNKIVEQSDNPYYGYIDMAHRLKIDKGLTLTADDVVSRGVASQLIYNTLFAPVVNIGYSSDGYMLNESEETVLNNKMNLYFAEGRVTANTSTDISGREKGKDKYVEIEYEKYIPNQYFTEDMLGSCVDVYYRQEEGATREIVYVTESSYNSVNRIDAKDIVAVDGYKLKYNANNRMKSLEIPRSIYTIYNGDIFRNWTMDDFLIPNGYVEFIDNNGDGKTDIANVRTYINRYVTGVDTVNKKIYFNSGSPLDCDIENGKNVVIVDSLTGKIADFSAVKADTMVSIYHGKNNKNYTVYINNTMVNGVLKKISNDLLMINDTVYPKDAGLDLSNRIGDTLSIWIDCEGYAAMLHEKIENTSSLGFILDVAYDVDKGFENRGYIKMLTEDAKIVIFPVAEKIVLDGKKTFNNGGTSAEITYQNLETALEIAALSSGNKDGKASQLVYYTVNDDGEINSVDTARYDSSVEPKESLQLSSLVTEDRLYGRSGGILYNLDTNSTVCNVTRKAKVFVVPTDAEVRATDRYISSVKTGDFIILDKYYIGRDDSEYVGFECYNASDVLTTDIAVFYAKDGSTGSTDVPGNYKGRVLSLANKYQILDDDGYEGYRIEAFSGSGLISYDLDEKAIETLDLTQFNTGDVVAVDILNNKVHNMKKLFTYSSLAPYEKNGYTAQDAYFYGRMYAVDDQYFAVDFSATTTPDLLSFYAENAAFVIYNSERQIYRTSSIEEFLGTAQTGGTGMNVFVYTNWGVPYLVIGYEE